MDYQKKLVNLVIRTTPEDRKQFHNHAKETGLNLSELIYSLLKKSMRNG